MKTQKQIIQHKRGVVIVTDITVSQTVLPEEVQWDEIAQIAAIDHSATAYIDFLGVKGQATHPCEDLAIYYAMHQVARRLRLLGVFVKGEPTGRPT